jgi:hypothetical protein
MASWAAVDYNGVSEAAIRRVHMWREWLENPHDDGPFTLNVHKVASQRDAKRMVECFPILLQQERIAQRTSLILIHSQQQQLHSGVLDGIARLSDPRYRDERHKLTVRAYYPPVRVNRRSLQHLSRLSHEVAITELDRELSHPSDGG